MARLVLTLDYEIFGNGAGDVMRDVIEPTRRLLTLCERHNAKLTILFEVGEYWAFERYDRLLRQDLGYSPCGEMRKQATEAIRRGHDVQLHLHPQWIGAEYDRGVWQLLHSFCRLADLPDGLGHEEQLTSIVGALHAGKRTLEDMLCPVRADYRCVGFRAGGFYAQPSRDIIRAMKRVGLKADSSVVKGYRTMTPFAVSYAHVTTEKSAWWTTDAELGKEGAPGENVLELSVSSRMEPYWKSFKPTRLQAALKRRRIERASVANGAAGPRVSSVPTGRTVLRSLLTKHASTFDFCKLSCKDMLQRVREHNDAGQQPIVMIGHSKDFGNDRQFDEFLAVLSRNMDAQCANMSDYVQQAVSAPRLAPAMKATDAGLGGLEIQ